MRKFLLCLLFLALPTLAKAYAVLTHEAVVDAAWTNSIQPLLLKRFPHATQDQLLDAHAYAYGGCIIQDLGYYPFGSKFFSDLVHYVRSGDFVVELVRQAKDLNDFAFALGALAHYASDNSGHPIGVNPAVALSYPKLRARYGDEVTYQEDPVAHMKVEFGFDVLQVAEGHYAPKAYHDFIGFKVSKPLLESAFQSTYGLKLSDVFLSVDLALGTYRHTVSGILPEATKVAWDLKKDEIVKAEPGMTKRKFIYNLSRASYEKEWGREYERPGIGARILAFFFRLIPKVGPFRGVQFKPPTPETAKLFMASFNTTLDRYRAYLGEIRRSQFRLSEKDLDTGLPTREGEYRLADDTYAKLARTLAEKKFAAATPEVRKDVLDFFSAPKPPADMARNRKKWCDTLNALAELRAWQPEPAAAGRGGENHGIERQVSGPAEAAEAGTGTPTAR